MCCRQIGLDGGWASSRLCRQTARGLESGQFRLQTVVFLYNGPAAWTWLISSHVHAEQCCHCVFPVVYIYVYPWCVCVCVCVCVSPRREGIQWEAIDWMDNAECLDLIEKVTDIQSDPERAKSWRGLTANREPERANPDATLCLHWPPFPTLLLYSLILRAVCTVMYSRQRLGVWLMCGIETVGVILSPWIMMVKAEILPRWTFCIRKVFWVKIRKLGKLGGSGEHCKINILSLYLFWLWLNGTLWGDSCCNSMTVCFFTKSVTKHRSSSVNPLFINKKENWMNYYAVSWTHCYTKSCQMCPDGIITSSIMTVVCFTLSTPLVCLPFRNWACWLLSMRKVASPKARTTPF